MTVPTTTPTPTSIAAVAAALTIEPNLLGEGRAQGFFVRLTPTVRDLLETAKPPQQSLVHFLRESAIATALQRLEASQD